MRNIVRGLTTLLAYAALTTVDVHHDARADIVDVNHRGWLDRPEGSEFRPTGLFCPMQVGSFRRSWTDYDAKKRPTCVYRAGCTPAKPCQGSDSTLRLTILPDRRPLLDAFRADIGGEVSVESNYRSRADQSFEVTGSGGRLSGLWLKHGSHGWFAVRADLAPTELGELALDIADLMNWQYPQE
jgi:hypothetical protein